MRRQAKKNDIVQIYLSYEVIDYMTAMIINDQNISLPINFFTRLGFKTTTKSFQINVVIHPISSRTYETPILFQIYRQNPFVYEFFSFKYDKRRNRHIIDTNTLKHYHPFMSIRLLSIIDIISGIYHTTFYLYYSNIKSILIHVVHIFQVDIILNEHLCDRVELSFDDFSF